MLAGGDGGVSRNGGAGLGALAADVAQDTSKYFTISGIVVAIVEGALQRISHERADVKVRSYGEGLVANFKAIGHIRTRGSIVALLVVAHLHALGAHALDGILEVAVIFNAKDIR